MPKVLVIVKDGMLEKVFSDIPLLEVSVIELKSGEKIPFVDREPCQVSNYSAYEIETAIKGAEMQIQLYLEANKGEETQDGTGSTDIASRDGGHRPDAPAGSTGEEAGGTVALAAEG